MPLADYTAIANLALDHLGEPYLTAYETDTTVAAQAARLHLPQCIETVLEGHVWSFATRCQQLTTAPVTVTTASATLEPAGENNSILFTAVQAGPAGNDITVTIQEPGNFADIQIVVTGTNIAVTPPRLVSVSGTLNPDAAVVLKYGGVVGGMDFWTSDGNLNVTILNVYPYQMIVPSEEDGFWTLTYYEDQFTPYNWTSTDVPDLVQDSTGWAASPPATGIPSFAEITATAQEIIDAVNADESASLLVTAANGSGSDGTGQIAAVTATNLSGGSSTSSVYAPAYGAAFNLPSDCLRVIKLDGTDIDVPQNRWEIQGRHLLLEDADAEAPVIHYITNNPPVDEWPTTFTDAVVFLLASRLAPKLAQDPSLAGEMLQKHEMALGKARSKDARETRSKENHGPRQLAVRSGLVRARYGNSLPPY